MKNKAHLTPSGLARIREIKEGMNKGRKKITLNLAQPLVLGRDGLKMGGSGVP